MPALYDGGDTPVQEDDNLRKSTHLGSIRICLAGLPIKSCTSDSTAGNAEWRERRRIQRQVR